MVPLVWYAALLFYFCNIIFVLPHAILLNVGLSQNDINRMYFEAGNYTVVFFFIFLIAGAAMLIAFIKKQTASIPATASVSLARAIWNGTRMALLAVVLIFLALVITRIPAVQEKKLTEEAVNKIHSQKITIADVLGNNLPPEPDSRLKDYTVAGIDANNNGIRDDVELAIFKLHPDSAKIRAAELQYAMALQMKLTEEFNTETWKIASIEDSRGYACISETYPRDNLQKFIQVTDALIKEIDDLQYNTSERKEKKKAISVFATSFALPNKDLCQIDLNTLKN